MLIRLFHRLRFIVQRSLFNVLTCFTNIGLFKNSRPFINLARKVRAVIFQRQQSFNFLDNLFNSILKLLAGELMKFCQLLFSYELIETPTI